MNKNCFAVKMEWVNIGSIREHSMTEYIHSASFLALLAVLKRCALCTVHCALCIVHCEGKSACNGFNVEWNNICNYPINLPQYAFQ